jgi:hypothetical protein
MWSEKMKDLGISIGVSYAVGLVAGFLWWILTIILPFDFSFGDIFYSRLTISVSVLYGLFLWTIQDPIGFGKIILIKKIKTDLLSREFIIEKINENKKLLLLFTYYLGFFTSVLISNYSESVENFVIVGIFIRPIIFMFIYLGAIYFFIRKKIVFERPFRAIYPFMIGGPIVLGAFAVLWIGVTFFDEPSRNNRFSYPILNVADHFMEDFGNTNHEQVPAVRVLMERFMQDPSDRNAYALRSVIERAAPKTYDFDAKIYRLK